MISSTMPSAKYSCSGSPLRLANGSTAIDGLSGSANSGRRGSAANSGAGATGAPSSRASPTKRTPLRAEVRIRPRAVPLSPTARRAAAIRLSSVALETIRPPHTDTRRSSFLTTRSRFSSR